MSDYTDLVQRLRARADQKRMDLSSAGVLDDEAADAIEELMAQVAS